MNDEINRLQAKIDRMEKQIAILRNSIDFATQRTLWIQREGNVYEYRDPLWYADVLRSAVERAAVESQSPQVVR